jgi:8-oxo-dGTP pyrophosphatase MutT (NUDIX family)
MIFDYLTIFNTITTMDHIIYNECFPAHYNEEEWQRQMSFYPTIEAAGGIVQNANGDVLMIRKRGKWEFPKGKCEDGESLQACALREVTEECGIAGLSIVEPLTDTYHVYEEYLEVRRIYFKHTYWFVMRCDGCPVPQPQAEEDIEQAAWIEMNKASVLAEKSYPMIGELLKIYHNYIKKP